jgi:hypothetical protein
MLKIKIWQSKDILPHQVSIEKLAVGNNLEQLPVTLLFSLHFQDLIFRLKTRPAT